MPCAIVAAAIVAGIFGLIVGLPSLRLKGDYLAVVTLGFSEIFRLLIASASTETSGHGIGALLAKLGGQQGYAGPDEHGVPQYAGPFWIVGGVMVAIISSWRLKFSGWGRALRALREDEIAAAAVGVDPTRYKVTSFVIAAMGGGFAGALLALMRDGSPTVQPDTFGFLASFDAITMVILGGSGSVSGAVLGGIFVTVTVKLIEQLQRLDSVKDFTYAHPSFDLNACRMVFYAAVLIAIMVLRPSGVFGENEIFKPKRRALPKAAAREAPEAEESAA
jgi:branched-chain amino acid transport system permease protein